MPAKTAQETLPAVISQMAITTLDMPSLMEALADSGDLELSPLSLDRIKAPSGDSLTFTVPTVEGPEPMKTLDAVILHHHKHRQYYARAYDGAASPEPPLCSSYDGKTGTGNPGGVCAKCPLSAMQGQCHPYHYIYILFPDETLPKLLVVPRTSLPKMLAYLSTTPLKTGRPLYGHLTRFGLAKRERGPGMTIVAQRGPDLDLPVMAAVRAYAQAFRQALQFPTLASAGVDPTAAPAHDVVFTRLEPEDDDIPETYTTTAAQAEVV